MLIELSYLLNENIPKWPTNPNEKYDMVLSTDRGDANNASSVYHHMHNGTHVDAPRHFDPKGKTIDQIPVKDFYFANPLYIEYPRKKGEAIHADELKKYPGLASADILLVHTGYSEIRSADPNLFVDEFPYIGLDAAEYLRKECSSVRAIAIDTLSADSPITCVEQGYPSHHMLLETSSELPMRTLLIFEDVNLSRLVGVKKINKIYAFPVRWEGLEAGPVTMVADVDS